MAQEKVQRYTTTTGNWMTLPDGTVRKVTTIKELQEFSEDMQSYQKELGWVSPWKEIDS